MQQKKSCFKSKLPLNEKWRGLKDTELQKVSGIKDAVFVHVNGFLGGCKSYQGALAMCEKSMLLSEKK